MGRPGPSMTPLLLCITFLSVRSFSEAGVVSHRLPTHVFMKAIIVAEQEPLNLDHLSLTWEHDGRPLVEYKDSNVAVYDSRVSMPEEQFKDGNFSLMLHNYTASDSGNYTCLIQYNGQLQTVQYSLLVDKHRFQLHDLSQKTVDEIIDKKAQRFKQLMNQSSKKYARESRQPSSGLFLNIGGYSTITAKPGENVSLMCKFHTDPSMELTMLNIRWSKEGATKWIFNQDFRDDNPRLEELSRGHASLNLSQVQKSDSGKYTCNILYRTLERNLSTVLIVKDGDTEEPVLQFTTSLQDSAPASTEAYRKEKIGMVVGVVAFVNCLAYFIYFCFTG